MAITVENPRTRYGAVGLVLAGLLLVLMTSGAPAKGDTTPQVVRVEEEWELVIADPDPNTNAPQVTCLISPVGNVESLHAAFQLNYQSMPDYAAGGLQLQVWDNEEPLGSRKFPNSSVLQQPGETVRWTESLELSGDVLTFEITHGTSTTWSGFGGQGYLKASVPTSLVNLNGYSPTVSVNNSGVGYAGNRVESLVLRKVRLFTSDGQVLESEPLYSAYPRQ